MVYAHKAKLDVSLFLLNESAAATSSQTDTYFFSSFFGFLCLALGVLRLCSPSPYVCYLLLSSL